MLPVGRISKLFGLDGGFSVNLYDTFPDNFNTAEPLYVIVDMLTVPLFLEHFEKRGRNGAIMRFSDIDNGIRAEEFIGHEFFIKGASTNRQLSGDDEDELYFEDLIGYKTLIRSEGGGETTVQGVIVSYIDNEMNPLLCIDSDGTDIYVPAVDEFISDIDTDSETIEFLLPEGLLDLYI